MKIIRAKETQPRAAAALHQLADRAVVVMVAMQKAGQGFHNQVVVAAEDRIAKEISRPVVVS